MMKILLKDHCNAEGYSELSQTSTMELFVNIINGSFKNVWLGNESSGKVVWKRVGSTLRR